MTLNRPTILLVLWITYVLFSLIFWLIQRGRHKYGHNYGGLNKIMFVPICTLSAGHNGVKAEPLILFWAMTAVGYPFVSVQNTAAAHLTPISTSSVFFNLSGSSWFFFHSSKFMHSHDWKRFSLYGGLPYLTPKLKGILAPGQSFQWKYSLC